MKVKSVSIIASCIVAFAGCHTSKRPGQVHIDPSGSVEEIRAEILKYTPLGMPETEVQDFEQNRLHQIETVSDRVGYHSLGVCLGKYGFSLLGSKRTFVEWKFDSSRHLVEVEVTKSKDVL